MSAAPKERRLPAAEEIPFSWSICRIGLPLAVAPVAAGVTDPGYSKLEVSCRQSLLALARRLAAAAPCSSLSLAEPLKPLLSLALSQEMADKSGCVFEETRDLTEEMEIWEVDA